MRCSASASFELELFEIPSVVLRRQDVLALSNAGLLYA